MLEKDRVTILNCQINHKVINCTNVLIIIPKSSNYSQTGNWQGLLIKFMNIIETMRTMTKSGEDAIMTLHGYHKQVMI